MSRGEQVKEILKSYGFETTISRTTDWCGTPLIDIRATGHGLVDVAAFERDMPLAESVAEAGVVVKTGDRVGYWLRPGIATWWEPHSGLDSYTTVEDIPVPLDDPRWQSDHATVQARHNAKIGGTSIDVMAGAEYRR